MCTVRVARDTYNPKKKILKIDSETFDSIENRFFEILPDECHDFVFTSFEHRV